MCNVPDCLNYNCALFPKTFTRKRKLNVDFDLLVFLDETNL